MLQDVGLTDFGCQLLAMMLKGNSTCGRVYLSRNSAVTANGVDLLVEAAVWRKDSGGEGSLASDSADSLAELSVPIHPTQNLPRALRGVVSVDG